MGGNYLRVLTSITLLATAPYTQFLVCVTVLFYGCLQLGGLDIQCTRNIYGRQISSFEGKIKLQEPSLYGKDVQNSDEFHGIFIRAPGVAKVYSSSVKILATLADAENSIVAVQQHNMIATCFHPELTSDSRWHLYFVENILASKYPLSKD